MAFPVVNGLRSIEFGNPGSSREILNHLVLEGNKRATAGLFEFNYEAEGEPIEHIGERLAMLDNDGNQIATLVVRRIEVLRFADVPDEFALAEAEGDLTAADFRESHLKFWKAMGYQIEDDTLVVTMYFDLLEDLRTFN